MKLPNGPYEKIALAWCALYDIAPDARTPDGPFIIGMVKSVANFHAACGLAGYDIVEKKT